MQKQRLQGSIANGRNMMSEPTWRLFRGSGSGMRPVARFKGPFLSRA